MSSVTQRIDEIKQPRGGYLNPKELTITQLPITEPLSESESVNTGLVGSAVDYLTRFMTGAKAEDAFRIPLLGAERIGKGNLARELTAKVKGLDEASIIASIQLAGFDVCFRCGPFGYRPIEEINPDKATIRNVEIMVKRSLDFFKRYGPVKMEGINFFGGYTDTVDRGDADFATADTLWDFKVSAKDPTNKHTLQLLMYFIMGRHSIHVNLVLLTRIGIYNPRLNRVYIYDMRQFPEAMIKEIERDVLGYK